MIRVACEPDWENFLVLASAEGWRVPRLESRLFQGPWLPFARVLEEGETFCGMVTAVAHQHSGWIGNLIVSKELRGKGYGSQLFLAALSALEEVQLETVWLTA
jgi:N-acetylglutamate synthase-like GNAT family acetyltransferase